jgi:hypothetical protein
MISALLGEEGNLAGSHDYISEYLDPSVDVEIATLGLPAPKWMGLDEFSADTALVCIAERVASGDCNDGIDSGRLCALVGAMLPRDARLHAWLQTGNRYRQQVVDQLGMSNIAGFAPFDVRTIKEGMYSLKRVTEINFDPRESQLLNVKAGILAFSLSGRELHQIGLPNTVLTFAGWEDDRMAFMLAGESDGRLLTCFPSWSDLVGNYEVAVFPSGDHGSDCIVASKCMDRNHLGDVVQAALNRVGWSWADRGHIEGDGYEQMYKRSMAEMRHPGHSRIDLDMDQD